MKKLTLLLIALFMIGLLAGCNSGEQASAPKGDDFNGQILFNGSSSLAPIIAAIAKDFTEKYETWDKVDASLPDKNISIYVSSGGSGVGAKGVIEKTCDFGMLARPVKDKEKEAIKDYQEFMVGFDALTVSVNKDNPIASKMDDMSTDLVRKIFAGEIKTWNEIDPSLPNEKIEVIIRDLSGGAYEVFQKAVMGDTKISPDAIQSPSMGALAAKIVENKNAIGYAGYGVYNKNKEKLFAFKVDGVAPTEENILNKSYKIQRPLLFIHDGELTKAQQAFVDYIFSEDGKKAIIDNGYIPK